MKKFGFNEQMRNEPFLIVIYHSLLVKGAMNAALVCKLRKSVQKPLNFFFFTGQRRNKDHSALVNCGGIKFLKLR